MRGEVVQQQNVLQYQKQKLHPAALAENEIAGTDVGRALVLMRREKRLEDPFSVQTVFIGGPSDIGKSQLADHTRRANLYDPTFQNHLKENSGNPDQTYFPVEMTLSQVLTFATALHGLPKEKAGPKERQFASMLMIWGVNLLQSLELGKNGLSTDVIIDSVIITESDLGKTAAVVGLQDEQSELWLPLLNPETEQRGLNSRRKARTAGNETEKDIDTLFREEGILTDTSLIGHENDFVESCGTDEAWKRHWVDIYSQVKGDNLVYTRAGHPSIFKVLTSGEARRRMYAQWIPQRAQQLLGITNSQKFEEAVRNRKVVFPDIPFIKNIHYHFTELYPYAVSDDQRNFQFPWQIYDPRRPIGDYSISELQEAMKDKERSPRQEVVTIFQR